MTDIGASPSAAIRRVWSRDLDSENAFVRESPWVLWRRFVRTAGDGPTDCYRKHRSGSDSASFRGIVPIRRPNVWWRCSKSLSPIRSAVDSNSEPSATLLLHGEWLRRGRRHVDARDSSAWRTSSPPTPAWRASQNSHSSGKKQPTSTPPTMNGGRSLMATFYRYSFDRRLVAFWGVFGVRPAKDGVTITDDGLLRATFGLLKLETTLENVDGAHITRNYRWWTAAGGAGLDEGRWAHLRHERERGRVHPLPREGDVAAQAQGPLRADGNRRGSRRADAGAYRRLTSNVHSSRRRMSRWRVRFTSGCRCGTRRSVDTMTSRRYPMVETMRSHAMSTRTSRHPRCERSRQHPVVRSAHDRHTPTQR